METPVEIPTKLERLSPSRASDYKRCPKLYHYKSVLKMPEPTSVYQARGTAAHLALEWMYELGPEERTADVLYDFFRKAWTEMRSEEQYSDLFATVDEETAWGVAAMGLLRDYFQLEDPKKVVPLDSELDMLEEINGMTLRGILDRMDEDDDGELVILDYKTGKAPPQRFSESAFFAMKIYAALIRQITGRTPKRLELLYLNGPTRLTRDVSEATIESILAEVRKLWDAINTSFETGVWEPKPQRLCDWCYFKDQCPAFAEGDPRDERGRMSEA